MFFITFLQLYYSTSITLRNVQCNLFEFKTRHVHIDLRSYQSIDILTCVFMAKLSLVII